MIGLAMFIAVILLAGLVGGIEQIIRRVRCA